jgi:Domain of unknown function (DUF1844)
VGEIKVTDRRMFTPDGRLKEEFERELEAPPTSAPAGTVDGEGGPGAEAAPDPEPEPPSGPASGPASGSAPAEDAPGFELPAGATSAPPAGLMELVEFVAGWALACMGDVPLPDGRLVRDLDGSRFYIDLLTALRDRFAAGLPLQEQHLFDSFLDQLRLRYVSRRG